MQLKEALTTGQVAKICGVTPPTVVKWIRNGMLKAYQIPSSAARRVNRSELVEFMKAHGIPWTQAERGPGSALVIDRDGKFAAELADRLEADGELNVTTAADPLIAGILLRDLSPRVVVLTESMVSNVSQFVRALKTERCSLETRIVVVWEGRRGKSRSGVDRYVAKTKGIPVIVQEVQELLRAG